MSIIPERFKDLNYNFNDKESEINRLDISLADNNGDNDIDIKDDGEDEGNKNKALKNIESNANDEIDYELNDYLNEFYGRNKSIPIIKFKKMHDNNYKYGKIQIIVIEEGDTFKIKDDNGVFSLNKFLELNASIQRE